MKNNGIYDHGFGETWNDVFVHLREGYYTSVTDYHEHDFYEINLILSGNVRILLGDRSEQGAGKCMVLTRPNTPHYISCEPDMLYSRLYLAFSDEFIANHIPEWKQLTSVFGEKGNIITLDEEMTNSLKKQIEDIGSEKNSFRQRLLIYYLLSYLLEYATNNNISINKIPKYVVETLEYLEEHYHEKIHSEDLAKKLHIGRTALMTSFKKYTGNTVGEYLTNCRLKNATVLLGDGRTIEYTAEKCGFSDSSGLIRAFKRCYGKTPKQYIKEIR